MLTLMVQKVKDDPTDVDFTEQNLHIRPRKPALIGLSFIFIEGLESVGKQVSGVSEEEQRRAAPTTAPPTSTSTTTTTMPSFSQTSGKRGQPVCVCVLSTVRQNKWKLYSEQ